jgi:hypothetical protein
MRRVVLDAVVAAKVHERVQQFPRLREAVEKISKEAGIPEEVVSKHLDRSVLQALQRLGDRYVNEMGAAVERVGRLHQEVDGYYKKAFGRKLKTDEMAGLRSALEKLRETSRELVPPDVWAQRQRPAPPEGPGGTPEAGRAPVVRVPDPRETQLRRMLDRMDEELDVIASHPDAPAMADEALAIRRLAEAGDLDGASARFSRLRRRVDIGLSAVGEGALERPFGGPEEEGMRTQAPTAPSGTGPAVHLDVNAPPSADPTGSRLLAHVQDALERFEHEGFTDAQRAALRDNPQLSPAFRGSRIDEFAKEAVEMDPELQHVIVTGLYEPGADFYDAVTGRWYDITTAAAWKEHVAKYGRRGRRLPTELK